MATKKPARNPVTEGARDAFIAYVHEWQAKMGLGDWRISVSDIPSKRNAAEVYKIDYEARLATIRLGADIGGTAVTPGSMEALAVHELGHILLHELIALARDQQTPHDVLNSAEHRVINTVQRLLAPEGI